MTEEQQHQPDHPDQEQQQVDLGPPTRWEIELEFIQSLSNPQYLNYLAQTKMLENEEFLNYLEYLEYWRKPENAQYIIYPNCLHILTLLKEPTFRRDIARGDVAKTFMDDYYMRWLGDSQKELPTITTTGPEPEAPKQENGGGGGGGGGADKLLT